MGLMEEIKNFKDETKHKLVKLFSKKYKATFEEVQAYIDHTYNKKAEAIITLNGNMSFYRESFIEEIKQYIHGKIIEMQSSTRESEIKALFEDIYFGGVRKAQNQLQESYETHYEPAYNKAIEYIKSQKHLSKDDRLALLDSIAFTHKQVLDKKQALIQEIDNLTYPALHKRIDIITSLNSGKSATAAKK